MTDLQCKALMFAIRRMTIQLREYEEAPIESLEVVDEQFKLVTTYVHRQQGNTESSSAASD